MEEVVFRRVPLDAAIAVAQGCWYVVPGVWIVAGPRSYAQTHAMVANPWLYSSHALFLLAVGGTLAMAGVRRAVTFEIRFLGAVTAAGLGVLDLVVPASPIYRVDLIAEGVFVVMWTAASVRPATS